MQLNIKLKSKSSYFNMAVMGRKKAMVRQIIERQRNKRKEKDKEAEKKWADSTKEITPEDDAERIKKLKEAGLL